MSQHPTATGEEHSLETIEVKTQAVVVVDKDNSGNGDTAQELDRLRAHSAPVETTSPLGRRVGPLTIILLNVGTVIGTGVYATPSSILRGTNSSGLALIYWALGLLLSASHLALLHEYSACFPGRSGGTIVFLEQAYPRPRYFFPLVLALDGVLLGFSSSGCIVMAKYLFRAANYTPTGWEMKGLAVGAYTALTVMLVLSGKWSYRASNAIGVVKALTLAFIAVAGLAVLGGHARNVADPGSNFRDGRAFRGSPLPEGGEKSVSPYGLANALLKVMFSYMGAGNAINVATEVRGSRPVRRLRHMEFLALGVVGLLFVLANVGFLAAVPRDKLEKSDEIAASLFFRALFGESHGAARALDALIAVGAVGSIVSVTLGTSRRVRESGRQGVLPFPHFWASTKPWGTPLGPYLAKWAMTTLMILAPPAGDAFNFIVDLQMYPQAVVELALTIGLILVRIRRRRQGLPRPEFRAWDILLVFNIATNLFVMVLPWYPPEGGPFSGDVSFWYAASAAGGVGVLLSCATFYVLRIHILPRLGGYRIRQELLSLDGGVQANRLVKVPLAKLAAWDAGHDDTRKLSGLQEPGSSSETHQIGTTAKE